MVARLRRSLSLWILALAPIAWIPLTASATVPPMMSYQGYLTIGGQTPAAGSYELSFAIYADSSGGSALWNETHPSVPVIAGVFNILLGSFVPLPQSLFDGTPRWIQTTVGDTDLLPLRPLITVPYSFRAGVSDTAQFAWAIGDPVWQTDGTNAYRLSGQVGIGTSSPVAELTVRRDDAANGPVLRLQNDAFPELTGTTGGEIQFGRSNAGGLAIIRSQAADWYGQSYDLSFWTGRHAPATERMRVTADGRVGIGTNGPAYPLDVIGDIRTSGTVHGNLNGTSSNATQWNGHSYGETYPSASNATLWNGHSYGETYPSAANATNATNATQAANSNTLGGLSSGQFLRSDASNTFSGGQLTVSNTLRVETKLNVLSTTGSTCADFSSTPPFPGYVVGINAGANANRGMFVVGKICATGGVDCSSDERLKQNIRELDHVLERLEGVRAVEFDWKDGTDLSREREGRREVGVIAQDLEDRFPGLVSEWGPDGYKAVDYGRLAAVLLEAVKELSEVNKQLESRLRVLEKRAVETPARSMR